MSINKVKQLFCHNSNNEDIGILDCREDKKGKKVQEHFSENNLVVVGIEVNNKIIYQPNVELLSVKRNVSSEYGGLKCKELSQGLLEYVLVREIRYEEGNGDLYLHKLDDFTEQECQGFKKVSASCELDLIYSALILELDRGYLINGNPYYINNLSNEFIFEAIQVNEGCHELKNGERIAYNSEKQEIYLNINQMQGFNSAYAS